MVLDENAKNSASRRATTTATISSMSSTLLPSTISVSSSISSENKRFSMVTPSKTRLSQLIVDNPTMGSYARVVRKKYQSLTRERKMVKNASATEPYEVDAVELYDVEFPSKTCSTGGLNFNCPLGIDLETDFYGKHAVVKQVRCGSVAYPLAETAIRPGFIVVAINGRDLSQFSFQRVLYELKTATCPRVIRFLDPLVLPLNELEHEKILVNRDQYGFAKDDKYIISYRKQLRKRKAANYEHEKRWAAFVHRHHGLDALDQLLHSEHDGTELSAHEEIWKEQRTLVLAGIPIVLRPRIWSILAHVMPYKSNYPTDYFQQLLQKCDSSPSLIDIEKDLSRTYPEHPFFQSDKGKQELKNVLCCYSLHNPAVGYCQSMNFIAGMMLLFMDQQDAFWLLCAMMQKCYLPAENYAQSMTGSQIDQLVFQWLVNRELPALAARLELCGIQIQLMTVHWFLCAFVCTLPTESALRVWDWFFLDGEEVLFTVAIGILKLAEDKILSAKTHSDVHTLVRNLGTDLHDEDALMKFLYNISENKQPRGSMKDKSSVNSFLERDDLNVDIPTTAASLPIDFSSPSLSGSNSRRLSLPFQHLLPSSDAGSNNIDTYKKNFTIRDIETMRAGFREQLKTKSFSSIQSGYR